MSNLSPKSGSDQSEPAELRPGEIKVNHIKIKEINISDIDLEDDRYQISLLKEDINFLSRSLKITGLVQPPMVKSINHRFVVISGLNTIKAYILNNCTTIIVQEVDKGINECQCLITSISSIVVSRQLTHAELIVSIKRLNQYINPDKISARSKDIFNTNFNLNFIKKLLSIALMPVPCLDLIRKGHLSIKSAQRISKFPVETQKVCIKIFSVIKASSSNQLEIIQNLFEISKRDKTSIDFIIKNKKALGIVNDNELNLSQKAIALKKYLLKKRFPSISVEQESLDKKIASLKLGNSIKIIPPLNFESQLFSFGFTVKSVQEFKSSVEILNNALQNNILNEILKK